MAYGSGAQQISSNGKVTFKGFSSRADQKNFKLYDFEVAKQDLINRLSIRKGERVENPEFGTIIYDALFEPFTDALKDAIIEDITANSECRSTYIH
jgi:phage baseplate assembly protein W